MKCPHGNELVITKRMGISTYCHDNGDTCKVMNAGNISLTKLHKAYLESANPTINSKYIKATIDNNGVARYVVGIIAEADIETIKEGLITLHEAGRITKTLLELIAGEFGFDQTSRLFKDINIWNEDTKFHGGYSYNHYYTTFLSGFFKRDNLTQLKCYEGEENTTSDTELVENLLMMN